MAILRSKGTVFKLGVSGLLAAIAQVIGLDLPEAQSETFEADYLDNTNAGIPYKPTGRTEGGELGYELWLDPALAGHQALTDLLTTPAPVTAYGGEIVFSDTAATTWPFNVAGLSLGGTVQLKEGVKAKGKVKLNGLITYP